MLLESFFAGLCYGIGRVGFAADEPLVHLDKPRLLQCHHMSGQVAIRYFQHLLQVIKTDLVVYLQYTHYAQPDPVVEYFIEA